MMAEIEKGVDPMQSLYCHSNEDVGRLEICLQGFHVSYRIFGVLGVERNGRIFSQ